MLAGKTDLSKLRYPVYASPKLDGIRGVVIDGVLKSRSLKPIPNPFVTARFSETEYSGLDGELILGSPTAKDVYRVTNGACARHDGTPDVKFYVFDDFETTGSFTERWIKRNKAFEDCENIVILPQKLIVDEKALLIFEEKCLAEGYEGLILRDPNGAYKFGRSTTSEGGMLKLKRFVDSEAEILEVYEEMENTNEKKTNELGRGARSHHQAGLVPKGRAGGLSVRDCVSKIEFSIGTGLNDEDREWFWKNRKAAVGKTVKYKSFQIGVKTAPRHPVYLGLRGGFDL